MLRPEKEKTMVESGNKRAPEGEVYVCGACGNVSHWRYGFADDGTSRGGRNDASPGWDESCSMNCGLVPEGAITEPVGWTYPQAVKRVQNGALDSDSGG
jgi:hypothetical protein